MAHTIAAFGERSLDLMVTVVLFVLSSSLTFPQNLWEIESESLCTLAISKVILASQFIFYLILFPFYVS
ncbi:hypothetical protein CXB51_009955 [Gossypium anomalum]|uniref:Uncharacterized protein n=1 Tax=Gossypium anomalum TaxID=47600 RepID=A0A8J5YT48_9ROSI|nr:hypothetical protein CXB51_009955 [Gossypium anomalum]